MSGAVADRQSFEDRRAALREQYLMPPGERPASAARGLHQ